jgi:hypothetical protein
MVAFAKLKLRGGRSRYTMIFTVRRTRWTIIQRNTSVPADRMAAFMCCILPVYHSQQLRALVEEVGDLDYPSVLRHSVVKKRPQRKALRAQLRKLFDFQLATSSSLTDKEILAHELPTLCGATAELLVKDMSTFFVTVLSSLPPNHPFIQAFRIYKGGTVCHDTIVDIPLPDCSVNYLNFPQRMWTLLVNFPTSDSPSQTEIHVEMNCASGLAYLLNGEKTWHFWPPSTPIPASGVPNHTPIVVVQKHGQTMIIPGGWWHVVKTTVTTSGLPVALIGTMLSEGDWDAYKLCFFSNKRKQARDVQYNDARYFASRIPPPSMNSTRRLGPEAALLAAMTRYMRTNMSEKVQGFDALGRRRKRSV